VLVGLLGDPNTGVSPCILPVLPDCFFASNAEQPGVQPEPVKSREAADSGVAMATQKTKRVRNGRPYG
jgi:cytochrome c biogenesis protein CcdA